MLEFQIGSITRYATTETDGLTAGTVSLDFWAGEADPVQGVEVQLRILTRVDATLEQVHEALLEKAVDVMRQAVAACEGKSARELLEQSAKDEAERFRTDP
ncbi:MAG: hypothetical protein KF810_02955 [Rhizobiaceae bacterium]|nr:hypothetical protein [Rhizobiaceae bacterium]